MLYTLDATMNIYEARIMITGGMEVLRGGKKQSVKYKHKEKLKIQR